MALLDRQRAGVRLGAIRIGTKVVKDGKTRPVKLDTFRLTSPDRDKMDAAAALYGGTVEPWQPDRGGPQWQVTTTVDALPVRVPPGDTVDQWYELWTATRQRKCDGRRESMSGTSCVCPVDLIERNRQARLNPPQACKPTTRLALILADLPGLGVWTLTSTGDGAADELAAVAAMLSHAQLQGTMLPARLRLEQRSSGGSGTIHNYAVPVLDVGAALSALEAGYRPKAELESGRQLALEALEPVPDQPRQTAPPPTGAPQSAQALHDQALQVTDLETLRSLWRVSQEKSWLEEFVTDPQGVSEPLENALWARKEALGGAA